MPHLTVLMLKSSSVTHEEKFNSSKKKKTKQTTAAILSTISLLFRIINRLNSRSLLLTRGITFFRCQERRANTNTHSHSYSSADFSITHCTLRCTIIITLKLFQDTLTKQKSSEGMHTTKVGTDPKDVNTQSWTRLRGDSFIWIFSHTSMLVSSGQIQVITAWERFACANLTI